MKIFDCTQFVGKPDAATMEKEFGFFPAVCPNESDLCLPGGVAGQRFVDVQKVEKIAASAYQSREILILDIEDQNGRENVEIAISAVKASKPGLQVGAWGYLPAMGPQASEVLRYPWSLKAWLELQASNLPAISAADFLFPSFYSTGNVHEDSALQAIAFLWVRNQPVCAGKSLYPFLSNRIAGLSYGAPLGKDLIWNSLGNCRDHADGCVLWSNPGEPWDPSSDFIQMAKIFAKM